MCMSKIKFTQMKIHRACLKYILIVFTVFLISCEEDYETDADDAAIPLTHSVEQIKAPGRGQYKLRTLSGDEMEVVAHFADITPLKSFTITKTVNLAVDETYGINGVLTVDPSAASTDYRFKYTPSEKDVDQLVGFTFRAEGTNGTQITSDLELAVTLSPRDNLPRRKWLLKSKIWVDGGNVSDIKDCEKDNYFLFNIDKTMSLNYGTNTGSAGCDFDGFNVYDTWSLSEDEKVFTMVLHSIFSPDNPQTETYRVKTLTTEKLELEIDYDLTVFGLGPEETFLYEYVAIPK
jgi:hypothetical protein